MPLDLSGAAAALAGEGGDTGDLGGSGGSPAPASVPATPPAPQNVTPPTPSNPTPSAPAPASPSAAVTPAAAGGTAGSAGGAGAGAAAAAAAEQWTLRSELGKLGVDASQFTSDDAAWQFVRQQMVAQQQERERLGQYAQWGLYFQQNQAKIQQALQLLEQQGQAPAKAAAAPQAGPFGQSPDWDPKYEQFLTRDAQGNIVAVPGADPTLPQKYQQYIAWQREAMNTFLRNPADALKPVFQDVVKNDIASLIRQELQQYQQQQFGQQVVQQNRDWLYAKDPMTGQPAVDYLTGQPKLSRAGEIYRGHVERLAQSGVSDPRVQHEMAYAAAEAAALREMIQHAQQNGGVLPNLGGQAGANPASAVNAAAVSEQQKAAAVAKGNPPGGARRIGNGGAAAGTVPPAQNPNAPRGGQPNLRSRLTKALEGVAIS
jgi:hypothetical protein